MLWHAQHANDSHRSSSLHLGALHEAFPRLPSKVPCCASLLCLSQLKDKWGFRMTARYDMYAEQLARYVQHDYKPQVVRDPSLE